MKPTTKSADGTSFHDTTITCSVNTLLDIVGEPIYNTNDGQDKTNFEWEMETEDGDVFTIYDWKEYRPIGENESVRWHIGGMSKRITEKAKEEIISKYRQLYSRT